jgi:hypothetical protein
MNIKDIIRQIIFPILLLNVPIICLMICVLFNCKNSLFLFPFLELPTTIIVGMHLVLSLRSNAKIY